MSTPPVLTDRHVRFFSAAKKFPACVAPLLLCCGLGFFPSLSHAQIGPATVTAPGPNFINTSTLHPLKAVRPIESTWLIPALAAQGFTSAAGWDFLFASAADSKFVLPAIEVTAYFAWVVNEPNVAGLDGTMYGGEVVNEDAGGCVFQFHYTPVGTDPVNIRFLSAYNESLNGGPFSAAVDNASNPLNPFYDPTGAAGPLGDGTSWFLDIPYSSAGPVPGIQADVQFNTFIATETIVAGRHSITLYDGLSWGYIYSTAALPPPPPAIPEPSTFALGGALVLVMLVTARRIRSAATASTHG